MLNRMPGLTKNWTHQNKVDVKNKLNTVFNRDPLGPKVDNAVDKLQLPSNTT